MHGLRVGVDDISFKFVSSDSLESSSPFLDDTGGSGWWLIFLCWRRRLWLILYQKKFQQHTSYDDSNEIQEFS